MDILYLSEVSPNRQNTLNYHVTNWGFHKCTELVILALTPTFYSYICSFLLYLHYMILVNVKSDVSGCKRISFQGSNFIGIDYHFNVTAKMKLAKLSSFYLWEFLKTFNVHMRQPYPKMDSIKMFVGAE